MQSSYVPPKVFVQQSKAGKGMFAKEKISKGEVVVDYTPGRGQYIGQEKADELYDSGFDYLLQVGDGQFFAATNNEELEDADFVNHSCDPNCGIRDKIKIIAMRDIEPGEEITFDYAMTESSPYEMKCLCGSEKCRGTITGDDWKIMDLQQRYGDFFSEYILEKIKNARV